MNADSMQSGGIPSVINPSMMNGSSSTANNNNNNNSLAGDKKPSSKNAKVTLDKNGKPKRKKASRGESSSFAPGQGMCADCV
jgi:hypothetical protein